MIAWKKRFVIGFSVYSVILIGAMVVYLVTNRVTVAEGDVQFVEPLITVASFSFLGAFLAYHRPDHRISWLLVAVAILQQTRFPSKAAEITLLAGAQPTLGLVFWGSLWGRAAGPAYTLLAYIFILFPDGRFPTPRFRLGRWILAFVALATVGNISFLALDAARAFASARASGAEIVLVPAAESLFGDALNIHVRKIPQIQWLIYLLVAAALSVVGLGLLSQVIRFRRGSKVERQQTKWVTFIMAVWLAAVIPIFMFPEIRTVVVLFLSPILPLGIAVPILRYRVWDIDLIIQRTLVYTLLTLTLGTVYFGSVVLLQQLISGVTGQQPSAAIVISTLVIAALFRPVRRRLQSFIDRRFYRRKYDAAQTLANFAAKVRDEVNVDRLTAELLHVIERTIQPESVSLWLRPLNRGERPSLHRSGEVAYESERQATDENKDNTHGES